MMDLLLNTLSPFVLTVLIVGVTALGAYHFPKRNKFPIINVKPGEWSWAPARRRFMTNAAALLREGQEKTDGPFSLVTDRNVMTYLPAHYADLIKTEHGLSFPEYAHRDMTGYLPGFDAFGDLLKSGIVIDCVQKRVTSNMDAMSQTISDTAGRALEGLWGQDTTFHTVDLHRSILELVCQVTSRVFVGPELSRNPEWLELSVTHTIDVFMGSKEIGRYPLWAQWIVQWVHPRCRRVRASLAKARKILAPILEQRRKERAAAEGGKLPYNDAIEWYWQVSGGRAYDEVVAQIGLAVAAVHTTGDLLFKTVSQLASQPAFVKAARQEIKEALAEHGMNKAAVFNLRLLDSATKETQRLFATAMIIMKRHAKEEVRLSNGVTIPKGCDTAVITDIMQAEESFERAKDFDPYRFAKIRDQGQETKGQLVSTTPDHISFGLGRHACPGRFFAAHEIKIMLCHLLMKYDIENVGADKAKITVVGTDRFANNTPRVQVRRRKEVEFEMPKFGTS